MKTVKFPAVRIYTEREKKVLSTVEGLLKSFDVPMAFLDSPTSEDFDFGLELGEFFSGASWMLGTDPSKWGEEFERMTSASLGEGV